jgi:hypothetical protein
MNFTPRVLRNVMEEIVAVTTLILLADRIGISPDRPSGP